VGPLILCGDLSVFLFPSLPHPPAANTNTWPANRRPKAVEEQGRYSLRIPHAREPTPTNIRSIGEMMQQILRLRNLLQITRPSNSAFQSSRDGHLASLKSLIGRKYFLSSCSQRRGAKRSPNNVQQDLSKQLTPHRVKIAKTE